MLLNSIYGNQSKRSLFIFIRLQVGVMKVKAYSRLVLFSTQPFIAIRAVSWCVHSLGGKSRK